MLVHSVIGPLRCHRVPIELPGEAHGEVADVDHLLYLADTLGEDLSHLEGDQGAERLDFLPQGVAQTSDVLPALGGGQKAPPVECLDRLGDHPVVIRFRRHPNGRQGLTGCGIDHFDLVAGGLEPLAGEYTTVVVAEAQDPEDLLLVHLAATTSISTRNPAGRAAA